MATDDEYEKEQARLRQAQGLDVEDDDLHLTVPKPAEVNPEVYRDVEPMLFKGFIYLPATVNGINFVFKSLNHHEVEFLDLLDTDKSAKGQKHAYSMFLAYGVLMIDGINVLPEREKLLPEIASAFDSFNEGARKVLIGKLSEINRRASRAVILTEAYATEMTSRLRWAQVKGVDLTSPAVTGLAGTERLGLNWGQLTWRAINYYEDLRETSEREWENAKFIASPMAGKGMSKVHAQDRQRRNREAEERATRKDKILRFALLGEPLDKASGGATIVVARTVEDLTKQLERDLKGEKDWHDMVVEAHERRARENYEDRLAKIREFQAQADEKYGDRQVVGETGKEGLTSQEVAFRLERRRQLAAQRLAQRQEFPEVHDPKVSQFVQRWVSPQENSISPETTNRPRALPFKKDER